MNLSVFAYGDPTPFPEGMIADLVLEGVEKGEKLVASVAGTAGAGVLSLYRDATLVAQSSGSGPGTMVAEVGGSGVSGTMEADWSGFDGTTLPGFAAASRYEYEETSRELARKALVALLGTIQVRNGYRTTVGDIFTSLARRADAARFPAIIVVKGEENLVNAPLDSEDLADDALHLVWELALLCFQDPKGDDMTPDEADAANDALYADIQTLFGNEWQMVNPDAPGEGETARLVVTTGATPFAKLEGQNYNGIAVRVRVRYSQDIHDPSIRV